MKMRKQKKLQKEKRKKKEKRGDNVKLTTRSKKKRVALER
jgi:hypothetical protein